MVTGIIGKKVGMTQLFEPDGTVYPATVLKAGPCIVAQVKTTESDGYQSVQLGLSKRSRPRRTSRRRATSRRPACRRRACAASSA